ncbi:hypothetical protein GN956_G14328 [Arapaima gigas]
MCRSAWRAKKRNSLRKGVSLDGVVQSAKEERWSNQTVEDSSENHAPDPSTFLRFGKHQDSFPPFGLLQMIGLQYHIYGRTFRLEVAGLLLLFVPMRRDEMPELRKRRRASAVVL